MAPLGNRGVFLPQWSRPLLAKTSAENRKAKFKKVCVEKPLKCKLWGSQRAVRGPSPMTPSTLGQRPPPHYPGQAGAEEFADPGTKATKQMVEPWLPATPHPPPHPPPRRGAGGLTPGGVSTSGRCTRSFLPSPTRPPDQPQVSPSWVTGLATSLGDRWPLPASLWLAPARPSRVEGRRLCSDLPASNASRCPGQGQVQDDGRSAASPPAPAAPSLTHRAPEPAPPVFVRKALEGAGYTCRAAGNFVSRACELLRAGLEKWWVSGVETGQQRGPGMQGVIILCPSAL